MFKLLLIRELLVSKVNLDYKSLINLFNWLGLFVFSDFNFFLLACFLFFIIIYFYCCVWLQRKSSDIFFWFVGAWQLSSDTRKVLREQLGHCWRQCTVSEEGCEDIGTAVFHITLLITWVIKCLNEGVVLVRIYRLKRIHFCHEIPNILHH